MGGFAAAARDWDESDGASQIVHLRLVAAGEPAGTPTEAPGGRRAEVISLEAPADDVIFAW